MVTTWRSTTGTTATIADQSARESGAMCGERNRTWSFDRLLGIALWGGLVSVLLWVGGA